MTEAPDKTAAPAAPLQVEQADHVEFLQAQARKGQAALALEAAQLRLQLAQQELAAAEAALAACAARLQEKYQLTDADTVSPDGAIWRAS